MRTYELVLIFDPALEMEQVEGDLQKLNEMIAANGLPRRWERWGKRRLTYEIKGRQYGYYTLTVFDASSVQAGELERWARLNTSVIRHLITTVDPDRVPEVDEESVRNLGAGATPPEVDAVKPEEEAVVPAEEVLDVIPDVVEGDVDELTEPTA